MSESKGERDRGQKGTPSLPFPSFSQFTHFIPFHPALVGCWLARCRFASLRFASLAQKLVPSAGCGSFLLAGAAMYRRISISTVSMVKSRFQEAMLGSLERST